MSQKILYLCNDCKKEFIQDSPDHISKSCPFCGSIKIYKSAHHQRYAKKSRSKVRWSYRI
jgi:DNA-directed RNA polymerase subunit RPC12/RpoP